ncbi:MAG: kinase [Verrucomicrobia bacterium]|nr:kinase [Verrucomicrobiota bacterium]MBU4291523.1 kinase [Verrucomicrobiota bacterium]MBU4429092.1 kinase [Verrucomicrobiota bacterium]MCG2678644.1 kinase [Kiritimatiellia bacterium]
MIISRTPFRISFFGGGTDYPVWYNEHGGAVLATSINRYCYINCRYLPPFFEHKFRIVYSMVEDVRTIEDIKHPAVRKGLQFMRITDGVEIHNDSDLPARAGLGSSSSFTVGLLHALHGMRGEMCTRMQLAQEAIHVERDLIGENVGAQDQVTAAFGGLNVIRFSPGDRITIHPVTLPLDRIHLLQNHLLLYFTGFSRNASEIAADQIRNTPKMEKELQAIQAMVDEAMKIIGSGDIGDFGRLLHEGWEIKRSLSAKISNAYLDDIYARGLAAGAIGGKLLGAGGGGFMLFFVPPDKQVHFRRQMAPLLHVPFEFESLGSQIIFYEPSVAAAKPG